MILGKAVSGGFAPVERQENCAGGNHIRDLRFRADRSSPAVDDNGKAVLKAVGLSVLGVDFGVPPWFTPVEWSAAPGHGSRVKVIQDSTGGECEGVFLIRRLGRVSSFDGVEFALTPRESINMKDGCAWMCFARTRPL